MPWWAESQGYDCAEIELFMTEPFDNTSNMMYMMVAPTSFAFSTFFLMLDQIVLVHGFSKKTQQLKKQDIDLAEKRMEDWIRRFPGGGET